MGANAILHLFLLDTGSNIMECDSHIPYKKLNWIFKKKSNVFFCKKIKKLDVLVESHDWIVCLTIISISK